MSEDVVEAVKTGYASSGAALELGALVVDGKGVPEAGVRIPLAVLNRHGLVAGATGTGKTKTLQMMTEQLSAAGVPVFVADVKGDLSGLAAPGAVNDKVSARAAEVGQTWAPTASPVEFLALGGTGAGVPVRATITGFGPTLLAKVLGLGDVQTSSLGLIFHFADSKGLALLDLKDLRAVIQYLMSEEGKAELAGLGGLSKATAGVILRELINFADDGAEDFFGEPELEIADLLRVDPSGQGIVSCLELAAVQSKPKLFSTFLMWLLAELFENLPEVGDVEKPKLVFFFDEAHLLFTDASKDFLDQVAQTVRLIRSKGVGVFFVTQSPTDVPRAVLAQLGSRVQHALRAFTPEDAAALSATAKTYPTSSYDLEKVLTTLGTGEAIVTVLSEKGAPTPVAWTRLRAPQSLMGPFPADQLAAAVAASSLQAKYGEEIDRESAYERLTAKLAEPASGEPPASAQRADAGSADGGTAQAERKAEAPARRSEPAAPRRPAKEEKSMVEQVLGSTAFKSFARSAATVVGREITRSLFGVRKRR